MKGSLLPENPPTNLAQPIGPHKSEGNTFSSASFLTIKH